MEEQSRAVVSTTLFTAPHTPRPPPSKRRRQHYRSAFILSRRKFALYQRGAQHYAAEYRVYRNCVHKLGHGLVRPATYKGSKAAKRASRRRG